MGDGKERREGGEGRGVRREKGRRRNTQERRPSV